MIARFLKALLVVAGFCACGSDSVMMPDLERGLHEVGNLTRPRNLHVAALLQNGKVLITGGNAALPPAGGGVVEQDLLVSAEIFDPETGTSTPTGDLTAGRSRDHGILLPDGRVLIISGFLRLPIEKYDPHSGRFDAVADAPFSVGTRTATLLPNGEVLLISGHPGGGRWRVFDPATGTFSDTFAMDHPGYGHTATLLKDGRVLIVGGRPIIGEWLPGQNFIYDPSTEAFSDAGSLQVDRIRHKAVLLQDGRVMIVGGYRRDGRRAQTPEIYNLETNTFSPAGISVMDPLAALLLPSGRVFFIHRDNGNIALYNPDTQVFSPTGHSIGPWRSGLTVTLLDDGRVLIAGGLKTTDGGHSPESITDQILIFTP